MWLQSERKRPSLAAFVHRAVDEAEIPESYFLPSSAKFRKRCATATAELRGRIPGFMIPSLMIPVSRLPQGATGKVDRKASRDAVVAMSDLKRSEYRLAMGEKKRSPTTEAERKLHAIWVEVLKIPVNEIGIDNNFFHLGGDSINAMYIAARARAEGLALAVTDILENPMLSTLATLESKGLVDGLCVHPILPEGQSFLLTQWTPVYQCHDIEGPVYVDMLRVACGTVIANNAILRTAFIRAGKRLLQVVLKSLDRPLQHITTDENLMMYCDNLSQADGQISSTVNSAALQFSLVSNTSTRDVLIIRISHAQYDGLSMPVLLNDIAAEYSGMRTCAPVDFSSYMYFRASKTTDKSVAFWRYYLRGSSIANSRLKFPAGPSSPQPRRADDRRVSAAKEIPLPTAPGGITTANLVKAACAFVLARLTAQTDLILGQTVNGRSLPLPNIDKVLGACLNFIPLRVTLQKSCTAHELLQHVQAQSVFTLAYDYLDSSEVFKQSTDWPVDTRFSCVVQHQNLERTPGLRLPGTKAAFAGWAHFIPASGIWIIASPRESSLDVTMCTSEGGMSAETARGLVEEICAAIQSFANSPGDKLVV
ncbi:uncharacterized protein APUU_12382A [Aspergillus puulaauensis]|uniref:Carrier domain-containing protein n=1 Tax=Aspergillus puulaauensis TaxID=1220207 RepID=A0A7R8AHE3_9EURO|nr:uncharacterized protein APUU_12382A [Aspergillus puulaauensis]BCS19554.1 hypothetical protein APUU_12382A [Aspergillus puulaauensis]